MKRFIAFSIMLYILATICCTSLPVTSADSAVDISCKSACLVDFSSGQILFEKDSQTHLPVASMVKMMTILLTLEEFEKGNLTDETLISTTENASSMGGSQVFIDPYVEYSAKDMLKSVIMASANDASVALAEHIAGSESSFVTKMNEKAKQLGMNDTNYVNCTGLPAPEQYSCAKDCAIVLKEVAKYDKYHEFSTIWMDELVHPSGRKTELVNTNRLVKYYDGCDGGKTGSTNEAGCCLSATAKRNNFRLISVVIGAKNSQTRFNECSKLFNYGFANFESRTIIDSQKAINNLTINKGKVNNIEVFANEDYSVTTRKGQEAELDVDYQLPKIINAPLKQGQIIGRAIISKDGTLIKEIDLIVKDNVEALSYKDCVDRIATQW